MKNENNLGYIRLHKAVFVAMLGSSPPQKKEEKKKKENGSCMLGSSSPLVGGVSHGWLLLLPSLVAHNKKN